MLYLILLLISLGIIAAVAEAIRQWWLRQKVKKGELAEIPAIQENAAAGCCGLHETCESESLLAGVSKGIEYYEDEELDRFKGVCRRPHHPQDRRSGWLGTFVATA